MTMAAHADVHLPRTRSLRARLKAATGHLTLDRELATGISPSHRPELARRAEVLSAWRTRHRLADGLERVLVEAVAPGHERGASIPIQRDQVLAAQRDLMRLVAALRSEPGPPVRTIAAVSLLLTDGTGPVFAPSPDGALREAAFQAAFYAEAV
jgi:hypothetical protein